MKNHKKIQGKFLMAVGIILVAAAMGLAVYSIRSEKVAEQSISVAEVISSVVAENTTVTAKGEIPDYVLNPDKKLPTKEIDGEMYIGKLDIHTLDLSLAVMDEWDYRKLKLSPCLYEGTPYKKNFIIAGHHYESHFGYLHTLEEGDKLTFTDIEGNKFEYEVTYLEMLSPYDVDKMHEGDWDITIFTCTYDTSLRVTVRAKEVKRFIKH